MKPTEVTIQCKFCRLTFKLTPVWTRDRGALTYVRGDCKCGADASFTVELDVYSHPPKPFRGDSITLRKRT